MFPNRVYKAVPLFLMTGTDRRYVESVDVGCLEPDRICPFLFVCPLCVTHVPDVLHYSKQYCMEDLDRRVLCRVEP